MHPPELTDGDLVLRAPRLEDHAAYFAAMAEPEIARWWTSSRPTTPPPDEWFAKVIAADDPTQYVWLFADASTPASGAAPLLGRISAFELQLEHLTTPGTGNAGGEIGYWLTAPARGRGLMTRAVERVCTWLRDELRLHRVQLYHAVDNEASCRVAERSGFALEGTLRQSYRYGDGRFHDEHLHSRLL